MKYLDLPESFPKPLASLLQFDQYTRGESEFSVTDLIKPPQVVQLTRRHAEEMPPEDPRSNIYRVLGSAVHDLLEKVGLQNPEDSQMIEERLFASINGVSISGQIDLHCSLEGGVLTDWKHVKTSAMKFEKMEWHEQMNSYAFFLRQQGKEVTRARICAIFRDWAFSGFNGLWKVSTEDGKKIICKRTKDYPEWGCAIVEIPLWDDLDVARFLSERVLIHSTATNCSDEDLPECTAEERWRRDEWRVRKIGAVRAKGNKKFKTEAEARGYLNEVGPEFEISNKPGVAYRCSFYCQAKDFCFQLKRENFEVLYQQGDEEEALGE